LPAAAQDLLFDRIDQLSAPASQVIVEALASDFLDPERLDRQRAQMERHLAARPDAQECEMPSLDSLWYLEERSDVAQWLDDRGWTVSAIGARDFEARHDRGPADEVAQDAVSTVFLAAVKG